MSNRIWRAKAQALPGALQAFRCDSKRWMSAPCFQPTWPSSGSQPVGANQPLPVLGAKKESNPFERWSLVRTDHISSAWISLDHWGWWTRWTITRHHPPWRGTVELQKRLVEVPGLSSAAAPRAVLWGTLVKGLLDAGISLKSGLHSVALGCTRLHLVALLHFTPTNRVKFESCVFSSSIILIQWGDSSLLLRVSKIVGAKWAMDTTSSFLGFRVFLESPGEELKPPQSPCHFKSKGPCRGWCATGSWQEIESGRVLDEDWCSSGCRHGELSWKPFASWRLIWQFDITHILMYIIYMCVIMCLCTWRVYTCDSHEKCNRVACVSSWSWHTSACFGTTIQRYWCLQRGRRPLAFRMPDCCKVEAKKRHDEVMLSCGKQM